MGFVFNDSDTSIKYIYIYILFLLLYNLFIYAYLNPRRNSPVFDVGQFVELEKRTFRGKCRRNRSHRRYSQIIISSITSFGSGKPLPRTSVRTIMRLVTFPDDDRQNRTGRVRAPLSPLERGRPPPPKIRLANGFSRYILFLSDN